jgi:hypothetical protein
MQIFSHIKKWRRQIKHKAKANLEHLKNANCGVFRGTDHPCTEKAICIMFFENQFGYRDAMFLCSFHHPEKNYWTRRHLEIKGCRIVEVKNFCEEV